MGFEIEVDRATKKKPKWGLKLGSIWAFRSQRISIDNCHQIIDRAAGKQRRQQVV